MVSFVNSQQNDSTPRGVGSSANVMESQFISNPRTSLIGFTDGRSSGVQASIAKKPPPIQKKSKFMKHLEKFHVEVKQEASKQEI
jgi:hypothetical protein